MEMVRQDAGILDDLPVGLPRIPVISDAGQHRHHGREATRHDRHGDHHLDECQGLGPIGVVHLLLHDFGPYAASALNRHFFGMARPFR
jgi:hypothetical protein